MFGSTNILKDNDKEKYLYYGIAFDGKSSCSFNDDFARNVIIFGVDNNSSAHTDNPKNDFLILGEGDTFSINGSFGAPEKKCINFSKAKTKFCLSLHYNSSNSYLFVNWKEFYKFKASNKNINFPFQFCVGSMSNKSDYVDSEEVSLTGNMHDISVDYDAIDKSDILNIHKYLMAKNNIN